MQINVQFFSRDGEQVGIIQHRPLAGSWVFVAMGEYPVLSPTDLEGISGILSSLNKTTMTPFDSTRPNILRGA